MKKFIFAALALAAFSSTQVARACEECQLNKSGMYFGQFTILGNGTVRTWAKLNKGVPQSLGLTFSETALDGQPAKMPAKLQDQLKLMHRLQLPKEAARTGFTEIGLDYMPEGHEPKPLYTVPHFDIHFYRMPWAERQKITAKGANLKVCEKKPEAGILPAGYMVAPRGSVPMMGAHAIDPRSPEFHGKPFQHTLIYGLYDGKVNFIEPMVAISFLREKKDVSQPIPLPTKFTQWGYYPTRYSISFDENRREYTFALEGLVPRGPVTKTAIVKNTSTQHKTCTMGKSCCQMKPKSATQSKTVKS